MHDDTATEPRWWNEDTTFEELARNYAEACELTPENMERFVADRKERGYDGETLKQYADCHGSDVESVYDFFAFENLAGCEDDYYTVKQLATRALKHLYTRPREISTTFHAVCDLEKDLTFLSKKCDDTVRVVALQAAAKAAERITSEELKAVLATLADIRLDTQIGGEL